MLECLHTLLQGAEYKTIDYIIKDLFCNGFIEIYIKVYQIPEFLSFLLRLSENSFKVSFQVTCMIKTTFC